MMAIEDVFGIEIPDELITYDLFRSIDSLENTIGQVRAGGDRDQGGNHAPVRRQTMTSTPTTTPVTFDGCLGWLHRPAGHQATIGAVLCNPFGYEALCAYRGWSELAEALAAGAGIPALRFDYPGTGDSKGIEEDPDLFRAWIDSIKAAAAYLRATTGVERLIFCGVRLGATLAAIAAEEMGGVDSLVMVAPVITGKRYIRELGMQHKSWLSTPTGLQFAQSDDDGRAVGAYGFQLYPDSLEQLATVDLEKNGRHVARRVLLHDTCDNPHINRLLESYHRQGAEADVQIFSEYDKFLVDPWFSVPPRNAFNSVLVWLGLPPRHASPARAQRARTRRRHKNRFRGRP